MRLFTYCKLLLCSALGLAAVAEAAAGAAPSEAAAAAGAAADSSGYISSSSTFKNNYDYSLPAGACISLWKDFESTTFVANSSAALWAITASEIIFIL